MDEEERGRWWRGNCATTSSAARQANNKQIKKTKWEEQQQRNTKWKMAQKKMTTKNRVFHEIYQLTKVVCQKDQTRWYQTYTHTHTQSNVCMCVCGCVKSSCWQFTYIDTIYTAVSCTAHLLVCAHTHTCTNTLPHTRRERERRMLCACACRVCAARDQSNPI